MESTDANYQLPIGEPKPTFSSFGNSDLKTIQELCDLRELDAFIKVNAKDIWKRRGILK
jgi:hypothetical protein